MQIKRKTEKSIFTMEPIDWLLGKAWKIILLTADLVEFAAIFFQPRPSRTRP
jgi:hypothetical protein